MIVIKICRRYISLFLKLIMVISFLTFPAASVLASTTGVVTEHFADEADDSRNFTTASMAFTLGGNFSVSNVATYGWTGTETDDYFVDNYAELITAPGVVGAIQIDPAATFQTHELYIFPGKDGDYVSNEGTVIIRGSLDGTVKFTETVLSDQINIDGNINCGWTYVDLSSYSDQSIDKLEFGLTESLRYLAIDAFKHESTLNNATPTDIALSAYTIAENASAGTVIGIFSTTDSDAGDTHTYSLVAGDGSDDNALFTIDGSSLKLGSTALDYETTYLSFRIRTTDAAGAYFEKTFFITVTDYESPVIAKNTLVVNEDSGSTEVSNAHLKTTVNAGLSATYTLTATPNKGELKKSGSTINSGGDFTQDDIYAGLITYTPNANANGADGFTFSVTDGTNSLSDTFTIDISSVNDPPVIAANTGTTVDEEGSVSITQTILQVTDIESSAASLAFTVSTAPANGTLYKNGTQLNAGGTFTQEDIDNSRITYTHNGEETLADSFTFTVSDGEGGTVGTTIFSIVINPLNDDPTMSGLPSDITVLENTASNVDFSATSFSDADAGANTVTLTLSVSSGSLGASSGGGVTVSGSGNASITLTGTAANIDTFLNTASNIMYTGAVNSCGNDAATLTLSANDGGNTGAGGGGNAALGTVNIDITAPTPYVTGVSSTKEDGSYGIGTAIETTITFSHSVTVSGIPQLELETGSVDRTANYTGGSGSNILTFLYTAQSGDESADLDYKGTDSLILNGGTITSGGINASLVLPAPGSVNSLAGNKSIAIDATPPTAAIVVADTALRAGEISLITITFSEAATGFDNSDLTIANGILSAVASADGGITYTATFTPAADTEAATNVIVLDNTGVMDVTGNTGNGTTVSNNYAIDTKRPTAAVNMSRSALYSGETSAVTITFSEAVTGFDNSDLTVDNGTLTAVSSSDVGTTYTATFTADDVNDDTNSIILNLTGVTDVAGNTGLTVSSANYTVAMPTVPGAPTGVTATAGNGQATVSFTPPVSDGGAAITEYTVTADPGGNSATGAASPITVTGLTNGTAYTFTVTAKNSVGIGSASAVSNSVTPHAAQPPSSGGYSGNSSASQQTYHADVKVGESSKSTLPITVDRNSGNASVDIGSQSKLISGDNTIAITVPAIPNVSSYTLGIPVPALSTTGTRGNLTVNTNKGNITVPSNMLIGIEDADGDKAKITIGEGNKINLPAEIRALVGDRPLIQLTVSIDGRQVDWNNPHAPVTVSIPYTPTAAELKHPESIVIWYINGSGNAVCVPNGYYDPVLGMVTFSTTHFSDYAVAYNKVSFNDVSESDWYYRAVSFIAAREITGGTGGGRFSPKLNLTRGGLIVLMMRAYDIAPDKNLTDNFSDAGNTYYTAYLAAAKRQGITSGIGNKMYAPDREITRQEMFTLLSNILRSIGKLPEGSSGKTLYDFSDADQVAEWAKDAISLLTETGTIGGSAEGKLAPLSITTRAEFAQVLYSLLSK